jgi:putative RNA 2'-phosphotransferase
MVEMDAGEICGIQKHGGRRMSGDQYTENSKFLSYVLRHEPQSIGLALDSEGWADIADLIVKANQYGHEINEDMVRAIVQNSDKKRFAISDEGLRIRAVQGHSASNVDIQYQPEVPPEFLYHGTATRFLASILQQGLIAKQRHHVHLSHDTETANAVGKRYGKPVVLIINALKMHQQGFKFFRAANGVWLTDHVPVEFVNEAG